MVDAVAAPATEKLRRPRPMIDCLRLRPFDESLEARMLPQRIPDGIEPQEGLANGTRRKV